MSSESSSSSGGERSEQQQPADVPSTSTALTRRRASDEKLPSVAQNLARLRECEDYNMALALQEQEFSEHYKLNRTERKTVGGDLQKSLEEQKLALEAYLAEAAEIARRDEELARNIQREMEEEDRRAQLNQAQLDEELARRLQMEEEAAPLNVDIPVETPATTTSAAMPVDPSTPNNTPASSVDRSSAPPSTANGDEEMAARLQERYLQRFAQKPSRSLDDNTQNEFNVLMAAALRTKFPTISQPPPPPSYSDCMRGAGLESEHDNAAGSSKLIVGKKSSGSSKKHHTEKQKLSEKRPTRLSDREKDSTSMLLQSSDSSLASRRKSYENSGVSALESNCAMANSLLFDSPIVNGDCDRPADSGHSRQTAGSNGDTKAATLNSKVRTNDEANMEVTIDEDKGK